MEMEMEIESANDLKLSKTIKKNKSDKSLKIRLTDRDFEIFGFLLDQKFASLEQIYFRFFDARKAVTDSMPTGLHVIMICHPQHFDVSLI